jgi:hypothetical protein
MKVELGCDEKQFRCRPAERQPFRRKVHQSFDQNGSRAEIWPHLPKGTPKIVCNAAVSREVGCRQATKILSLRIFLAVGGNNQ